jgi:hypothetical protein
LLVIRGTRELLRGLPVQIDDVASTTALGDWFAQPVIVGKQSYFLLVSRLSLLPVVMRGGDPASIASDFSGALEQVLLRLGVAPDAVAREVGECRDVVFAAGDSASIRASVSDLAGRMKRYMPGGPLDDLVDVSLRLGDVPLKALGFALPGEVARRLLE